MAVHCACDRPSTAFVLTRVNWSLGDDHSPRVGECWLNSWRAEGKCTDDEDGGAVRH